MKTYYWFSNFWLEEAYNNNTDSMGLPVNGF